MYACIFAPGLTPDFETRALLESFTPVFGFAPETAVLDIRGLRALFGGPRKIAETLLARIQELGLDPSIAVADHPDAAVAAARGFPAITIIPPGEESRCLGPLPLSLLQPPEELQETLAAWGIRTFAQLAALPPIGLAERLGPQGVELQKLACGLPSKPLVPFRERISYSATMELEHPLELLEPLSFVLSRLLNDISGKLRENGLAANEVTMRLPLGNRTEWTRTIRLPFATREPATFLKLLQYDLAAHPPPAPVLAVTLQAEPVPPRTVQSGLFVPLAPEPEKLELTLARLSSIVGEGNVGSPELLDTHRPGAFRLTRFSAGSSVMEVEAPVKVAPRLSIRLFRPPLPAQVVEREGRPKRLLASGIASDVLEFAGPWRTCGDWWTNDAWARDEWDVALSDGTVKRIYREKEGWFVDGGYD